MKSVDAVGDDDDDNDDDDNNDDDDDGGDRLFTSTLVAAVEALRGHLATYSDLQRPFASGCQAAAKSGEFGSPTTCLR